MLAFFKKLSRLMAAAVIIIGYSVVNMAGQPAEAAINIRWGNCLDSVRLTWPVIPGAVSYRIMILENPSDTEAEAISIKKGIFINGYELDTAVMRSPENKYWAVCPVGINGQPCGPYTEPQPIASSEKNPERVKLLTQYEQMDYMPAYPVYSWVPAKKAAYYEVQVYRQDQDGVYQLIRSLESTHYILYEDGGFTWPGNYYWQVRAMDGYGGVAEDWSEPSYFTIEPTAKVVALGDSITHGGGAASTPPGDTTYNWETYCQVPVKNLGLSGDTVEGMNERFEAEVIPLQPKVLIIMGGVNNFRRGDDGWDIADQLAILRDRCNELGIIPVFVTATPINPQHMRRVQGIEAPAENWKNSQQIMNMWIKQQRFCIDVTPPLTGSDGLLREDISIDGLHPDYEGKKIMGEMINDYLQANFPQFNLLEK